MTDTDTNIKELLRQVKRIELRTRQAMNDLTAGAYKSRFRGQGMEFEEVREYTPGDDIRHIDWNVTARVKKPFIKVFREERELNLMMLVDCSGSMQFGALPGLSPRTKMAAAAEAAAVIGITAMQNKDKIGLVGFSDHTHIHLPAKRGRNHVMRMIRDILDTSNDPNTSRHATDISHALDELRRVMRKRSVCFLISDFMNPEIGFPLALRQAARKHDIIGLRLSDPSESHLPKGSAPLVLQDPESNETLCLANNGKARRRYRQTWEQQREETERTFRKAGCELVDLETTGNIVTTLQRFFTSRRRAVK